MKLGLLVIDVNGPGIEASLCVVAILYQMLSVFAINGCFFIIICFGVKGSCIKKVFVEKPYCVLIGPNPCLSHDSASLLFW